MLDKYKAILIYIECENDIKSKIEILQFIDKYDNCYLGEISKTFIKINYDLILVVIDIDYFELIKDEYNTTNILYMFILALNKFSRSVKIKSFLC